ncbi:MFS transporter [Galbitalea sp. SE-J8]|uniref:MFS transporter n=1 Tax=Galbitalea sp. SE-J8 TaxID=3054952 RepID=UPI00259D2C03|nr:MFS transporter [Galbitalea sp. SE-J8]MDM4761680.1 MFS transporter [Galbitalea sp. SE-J8]
MMHSLRGGFGRLWAASIVSNLADGLGKTAVPLIATTLTRDPFLIGALGALSFLPWLGFGVLSGVVVDRVDRRRTMAVANGIRLVAAAVVAVTAATGTLSIAILFAAAVVIGVGETFYDNSVQAMVPSLVPRSSLDLANGRMQTSDQIVQSFVATPIAGALFAVAAALPLAGTSAGYLVGGVLALALPAVAGRAARATDAALAGPRTVRGDVGEAVRYLWTHRTLRSIVLFTSAIAGLSSFAQAAMVLFTIETLRVPEAAFGLVLAAVTAGAVVGAIVSSRLVARFGRGRVMLASTVLSGIGLAIVGAVPVVWVAIPAYALGAFGVAVWNVPWGALRQQLTPGHLLGRMIGVIRTFTWGVIPVATLIGGAVARIDLRLPFVIGGALTAVVALLSARLLLSVPSAEGAGPEGAGPEGAGPGNVGGNA